ncbi:MAG: DUF2461 domain-containing protein [Bacteroidales bacterium]
MEKSGINQNTPLRMKAMFNFLQDLARNNNREWFQEHKADYDSLRKVFEFMVQELIEQISVFDDTVRGVRAKDSIFRIYRDTRFSHDKTPYKTHFGAWITKGGRKSEYPGYYLHLEPGNCIFAAGIWHPDSKLLKMVRQEIYDNLDEFLEIIHDSVFEKTFGEIQGGSLRILPRGFAKDFPEPQLLMLKDYFVEHSVRDSFFDEHWVENAAGILHKALPLNRFLGNVVDEYQEKE